MATKKAAKPVPFSPYHALTKFNGLPSRAGINWSYAEFTSQADCKAFDKACNDNGYRTRNMHKTTNAVGPDTWSVQYHHYND